MPVIAKINTHVTDARARLIQTFRDRAPQLQALLAAHAGQIQELEDALWPMNRLLNIDTMVGAQLDGIGEIVGSARDGMADAAYRNAIKAQISARLYSGTPDQIIAAYALLTGSTIGSVEYDEDVEHPAGFTIWGDGVSPANLVDFLESWAPAGVYCAGLELLITEAAEQLQTEAGEDLAAYYHTSGR